MALDKHPWVFPVGIGETLSRALTKPFMREAGDQEKTACGNIQLCAGLETVIEGATHAVGQRRMERVQRRRSKEKEADDLAEEEDESGGMAARLNNLTIETEGTKDEAAEHLETALGMEVEAEIGSKGEEGGDGTQRALVALEFFAQDAEPSRTMLVDYHIGFIDLSRLAMLWTVWPASRRG